MTLRCSTALGVGIAALIAATASNSSAFAGGMTVGKSREDGCYIGLIGGYGYGGYDVNAELAGANQTTISEDGKGDLGGGMIGGLAGCDLHVGNGLVLGVVGDLSWANIDGKGDLQASSNLSGYDVDVGVEWLGTARAIVGYEFGDAMIYGTGGVAVAGVGMEISDLGQNIDSDSSTQYGWAIGAGLNYMITDNVMLGAEYLYVDFGENSYGFGAAGDADVDLDVHIVRGSIGFRF